jgi:hypothetical protein
MSGRLQICILLRFKNKGDGEGLLEGHNTLPSAEY